MAESVQISCITKREHNNPHERIQGVGGTHAGKRWWLSEDDAISAIETGKYSFFVEYGKRVGVIVASHNSRKYLKTVADGYIPDNLLSLSSCPI